MSRVFRIYTETLLRKKWYGFFIRVIDSLLKALDERRCFWSGAFDRKWPESKKGEDEVSTNTHTVRTAVYQRSLGELTYMIDNCAAKFLEKLLGKEDRRMVKRNTVER